MSCTHLASTGLPGPGPIGAASALLIAGVTLTLLSRRCHARTAVAVLLLIGAAVTFGLIGPSPVLAATPACGPSSSASGSGPPPTPVAEGVLTISQTSSMTGIGPGVLPVAIAGTITYQGLTSARVTAVTVHIAAVIKSPTATAGDCDASDYVLLEPAMLVGKTLAPSESATFFGARLGFSDKTVNQDACKSARVSLSYVSS